MRLYWLILLFICAGNHLAAQILQGRVADSTAHPVPYASVTLLNPADSSILSFGVTDDEGYYRITLPRSGNYLIRIRSLGYVELCENITLEGMPAVRDFTIREDNQLLKEVVIDGKTGMEIGEDTVRYNPQAFTDGSERVLGEVLEKLPGIEVDELGNVKAYGKNVDKIMIDGKDFFGGNTQMAAKNLPADLAESVEVLTNYNEYSLLGSFKSGESTVINIGVNKDKWGKVSGNIRGGVGAKEKYDMKGDVMQIKANTMTTMLGTINNTGEQVFSIEDYIRLQGGLANLIGGQGGSFSLSEEEQRLLMPKNNTYSRTNALGALNLFYQPDNKVKLNAYSLYNYSCSKSEDENSYRYDMGDDTYFYSGEEAYTENRDNLFTGYVKLDYMPDPGKTLVYKGSFSFSGMDMEDNIFNRSDSHNMFIKGKEHSSGMRTEHNALFMRQIGGNLLLTNAMFRYSRTPFYYGMLSDSLLLPFPFERNGEWFYGRQDIKNRRGEADVSSAFLYRISGSHFLKSTVGLRTERNRQDTWISGSTPGEPITDMGDSLRNDLALNTLNVYGGIDLIKNKGKIRFKLGTSLHYYHNSGVLSSRLSDRNKWVVAPDLELSCYFKESQHYITTGFSSRTSSNSLNNYPESPVFTDYKSLSRESSFRKLYIQTNTLRLRYHIYDLYSKTMFSLAGRYSQVKRGVARNYEYSGSLSEKSSVGAPDTESLNLNANLDKGLSILPWKIQLKSDYSRNKYYTYLYGEENRVKINSTGGRVGVISRYGTPLNMEAGVRINHAVNRASMSRKTEQTTYRYNGKLKYKPNKKWYAETELEYVYNSLSDKNQDFCNLNVQIRYSVSKQTEIMVKGKNILHLNRQEWSTLTYQDNYMLQRYYRQIPGHLLLSLNYKF